MQLGWPKFGKKCETALDIVPLKKIIAVSDEYWDVLYSPIINTVVRSLGVYEKQKGKLYSDYVEQFVCLVRRSKGAVQDDPLLVHLHTFSLSLAFSSLYIARVCYRFEFIAISKAKKTKGERSLCFPWIDIPVENEIKLAKVDRLYPVYIQALSIFNTMINDTGWKWLHSKPEVLKGLFDSIYSDGEKGFLSGILDGMQTAPLESDIKSVAQLGRSKPAFVESSVDESKNNDSLDDLISGLGGNTDELSLDDLLDSGKQNQLDQRDSTVDNNTVDLSVFDSEQNAVPVEEEADINNGLSEVISLNENESLSKSTPVDSSDDVLDEFTAFLAATPSTQTNDSSVESEEKESSSEEPSSDNAFSDSESLLFSSESSITADLLKWCLKQVSENSSQNGVHVFMLGDEKTIAVERDKGVMAFVRSDYDLDNDAAYKAVAGEVLADLEMSKSWIENKEGGDVWEVSIGDEIVDVLLLNVKVPLSYQPLEAHKYMLEKSKSN